MNPLHNIVHGILHGAGHKATESAKEAIHEQEELRRWSNGKSQEEKDLEFELEKQQEFKQDKKNIALQEEILDCINNKKPFPIKLQSNHLYFLIYFCLKHNRSDLVSKKYMDYYNERNRKFRAISIANFFDNTLPFIFKFAVVIFILFLLYCIIWGTPAWFYR